jgi:hypothetical protein
MTRLSCMLEELQYCVLKFWLKREESKILETADNFKKTEK